MGLLMRHWKLAVVWAVSLLAVSAISAAAQGSVANWDSPFSQRCLKFVSGKRRRVPIERTQNGYRLEDSLWAWVYRPPRAGAPPGVVSVEPFFAKIIASSFAGTVWLAFFDTSCVAPGCS